jgi:hypothetical protein
MIELTITMVSESRFKKGVKRGAKKGKKANPSAKKGKGKAKKPAGGRSAMLKTVMPLLSGDNGDRLAAALTALDETTVASVMDGIRDRMVKQILAKKEKMNVK